MRTTRSQPQVLTMLVALLVAAALPSAEPTFNRDVSRIVQARCQECHHAGTATPFSLLTYENVVKHAETIREAVIDRRMPPWGADPHYGKFANDRHLTDAELQTLTAWIDGGRAKGDPNDAPPARQFADGWTIGEPDVIVEMPIEQDIPAAGTLDYKGCEATIPAQKEDWLVVAAELKPGASQVLHHAQLYVDSISNMVLSYAPGTQAVVLPPSTVFRIPRGQKLVWVLHYTPNGKACKDRSRVGLKLWKGPGEPKYERKIVDAQVLSIDIPPGAANVRLDGVWTLAEDREMIAVLPHMHLRGKDFRMDIQFADGRTLTPLLVPRYDFNWQFFYDFAEPIRVAKGSVVHMISHYDNSAANPANPDPTKRVRWGKQTEDEMQTVLVVCQQPFNRPSQTASGQPRVQRRDRAVEEKQDSILFRDSTIWIGFVGISALVVLTANLLRRRQRKMITRQPPTN
jgi:hypothetical protein